MQIKDKKNTEISDRISLMLNNLNVKPNSFAQSLGYKRSQTIYDIINGKSAPSFDFFNKMAISEYSEIINMDWLLTGRGNIFKTKTPENVIILNDNKNDNKNDIKPKLQKTLSNEDEIIFKTKTPENVNNLNDNSNVNQNVNKPKVQKELTIEPTPINVFQLRTDHLTERQSIPIYDMDAVAGLVPLFAGDYSQRVIDVMETTLIPKCDGGLHIVGDSMYPLIKSGDIVFYKQITDVVNSILWGEMYLISFDIDGEEYVTVKYIQKSEIKDHVKLVSYNEHHSPKDIHIGSIRALAFIKASLRLNSIK